jgi:hypothetical protein
VGSTPAPGTKIANKGVLAGIQEGLRQAEIKQQLSENKAGS